MNITIVFHALKFFGKIDDIGSIGLHQVVVSKRDIDNAIETALVRGHNSIHFYSNDLRFIKYARAEAAQQKCLTKVSTTST